MQIDIWPLDQLFLCLIVLRCCCISKTNRTRSWLEMCLLWFYLFRWTCFRSFAQCWKSIKRWQWQRRHYWALWEVKWHKSSDEKISFRNAYIKTQPALDNVNHINFFRFIYEQSKYLHPNNYILINAKMKLGLLYGNYGKYKLLTMSRPNIDRKIQVHMNSRSKFCNLWNIKLAKSIDSIDVMIP